MMELTVKIEDPEVEKLLTYLNAYPLKERYALIDRAKKWLELNDELSYPFIKDPATVTSSVRATERIL